MRVAWILAKTRWRERPGTLLLLSLAMALAAAVPLAPTEQCNGKYNTCGNKPKASPWLRGRAMPVKPIWFWPPLTLIREAFRLPVGGLSRRQGKTFPTASSRCTLGTKLLE